MKNPFKDLVFDLKKEYSDVCDVNSSNDTCYFYLDRYYFYITTTEYDGIETAIYVDITKVNSDECVADLITANNTIAFNFIKQLLK